MNRADGRRPYNETEMKGTRKQSVTYPHFVNWPLDLKRKKKCLNDYLNKQQIYIVPLSCSSLINSHFDVGTAG